MKFDFTKVNLEFLMQNLIRKDKRVNKYQNHF